VDRRRIVLLGATGYTGKRVLQELLARGEQPTLVGRSRTKMLAIADRLEAELPAVEADVTSTGDLTRLFEPTDVVVSTVGPFMQLGIATVTAAAQAGAHYLDSTGEATFVRHVFGLDPIAVARGATLVPAFGYDYVPGNLAGALALARAGELARRVEIGYFLTRSGRGDELRYRSTLRDLFTLTTGGTRTTLVLGSVEKAFAYRRPQPGAPRPPGRRTRRQACPHLPVRRYDTCRAECRGLGASRTARSLPPVGQRRCVHGVVRAMDPTCPGSHHSHRAAAVVGESTIRGGAAVQPTPWIAARAG
jgi:putative NADH-flavin reductase